VLKVTKYNGGSYFWKGSSRGGAIGHREAIWVVEALVPSACLFSSVLESKHRYNALRDVHVQLLFFSCQPKLPPLTLKI
jgi:hypothetical protein